MASIEIKLGTLIHNTFNEAVAMRPPGGFSSPRNMEQNKQMAIMDAMQAIMRKHYNPNYEIRGV